MLFILAWRNLWRNANRTIITMASIFFAVILSVMIDALQTGVFDHLIKNVVGYYTGYIQIHTKGYQAEQTLDNVMTIEPALLDKIRQSDNIRQASVRIETYVLASGAKQTHGALVTGIDPKEEENLIGLNKRIIAGRYLKANEKGVLLGETLADKLNLHTGDTIVLLGQGYHGSIAAGKYPIIGLLHFGSPDLNKRMIFMPLPLCREFLSMEQEATTIVLGLHETTQLLKTSKMLEKKLGNSYEVITWEEMMPEVVEHIETDKASGFIISLLLYLLVSFGIFSTLLMMLAERKFEFGMLISIGMKKRQLILVMLMESLMVSILGCLAGILASVPLATYLKYYPIRFSEELAKIYENFGFEAVIPASNDPVIFWKQGIIVLIISLLLSTYSLYRIVTMNPVEYMKR